MHFKAFVMPALTFHLKSSFFAGNKRGCDKTIKIVLIDKAENQKKNSKLDRKAKAWDLKHAEIVHLKSSFENNNNEMFPNKATP